MERRLRAGRPDGGEATPPRRRQRSSRSARLEEARRIMGEFIARSHAEWLIERLGDRTPAPARRDVGAAALKRPA